MTTWYERREDIAVLQIDHPPVNGLNAVTRRTLSEGIRKASGDGKVRAIIVTGTDKVFSGGADIREFGTDAAYAEPNLLQLFNQVENCSKPIIAAINGVCMGGGLELALACHYRIATPDAIMALPEVKIGLIPGAGGTQRLPRAVGAEKALRMIVTGEPISAEDALDHGLIERIVTREHFSEAMDFAHEVAERRARPRLRMKEVSLPPGVEITQFFAQARTQVAQEAKGLIAPLSCVDAVEASVKQPFLDGMATEQKIFTERVASTESKALRYAFFAQRAAAKIPDIPSETPVRPIKSVAILGFGTMGRGIAMSAAAAGLETAIFDQSSLALEQGLAACRQHWESAARRGRLTVPQVDMYMGLLKTVTRFEDLSASDIVIEAVSEDITLKQGIFKRLGKIMKPAAILATNTAALNIEAIAAATQRTQDVVGMHFFMPAQATRLVEVVRTSQTANDVLATVMRLVKKLNKVTVVSRICDGFIGNRMLQSYLRQAMLLLQEGASPEQVDQALVEFGMAMGPFAMSDMAGLEISAAMTQRRAQSKDSNPHTLIVNQLVKRERLGQKTNKGWYDYVAGDDAPRSSNEVAQIIEAYRAQSGQAPRPIDNQEIIDRCILALVNEGAHVLEDGVALRASDIDTVCLLGYGFPAGKGGPMFYAEQVLGFEETIARIKQIGRLNPKDKFWQPANALSQARSIGHWPQPK